MPSRRKTAIRHWGHFVLAGGTAVAAIIAVLRYTGDIQVSHAQTTGPVARADEPPPAPVSPNLLKAGGLSQAFRTAAQKVLPAVVVIKAGTSPVCPRCGRAHDSEEELDAASSNPRQPRSLDVLGSGFIVGPTGIVLTNKHVVEESRRLVVQTADGKQFPVKQVKVDQEHDVALLRIDAESTLPTVCLGDSDTTEIGDWVLTMGCPLELEQTVSAGIISAKNRSFCPKHQARYLQTDAVVNPGSSGGPLVSLDGAVIGITTSLASHDGGYQGIGFAVPANFVKPLLAQFGEAPAKAAIPIEASTR
jgi:serine protease Do